MTTGLATWPTSDSPGLQGCVRATTRLQAPSFHLQTWSASRTKRGHYYRLGRESCHASVVYPESPGPHMLCWALAHTWLPTSYSKVPLMKHQGTKTFTKTKDQP